MDNELFQREVTFNAVSFDGTNHITERLAKIATFKCLDVNDKAQHKLHFKIASLMQGMAVPEGEDEAEASLSTDKTYDLTVKFIKTQIVLVPPAAQGQTQEYPIFTAVDLKEMLNDSSAIFALSLFLLTEHILPFFPKLMPGLKK